ncbi:MAG: sulfite exporter TauE/SafE family protein [Burkholderiaceae bacterium]
MDIWFALALLALGCFSGFAAGLLGIGGGALMVPVMTFLFTLQGFSLAHVVHMAIATSIATILFTSLSSVRAHNKRGGVLWNLVRWIGAGGFVGTLLGAQIAGLISTPWLALVFALFIGYSAYKMIAAKPVVADSNAAAPAPGGMFALGTFAGAASSLVGAGGAFITVPYMRKHHIDVHAALGTSAAIGFPIAVGGVAGDAFAGWKVPSALPPTTLGYVYLPALLVVALASMSFAPLGARAAHALDTKALQRIFAVLLSTMALYMLYKSAITFKIV